MSVPHGVLLLLGGEREVAVIRALDAPGTGLTVTRRCADVAELLAASYAGAGKVAVLDAARPGVDLTVLSRLAAEGVRSVLLAAPADLDRWRTAHRTVPDDAPPGRIMAAVVGALAAPAAPVRGGTAGVGDRADGGARARRDGGARRGEGDVGGGTRPSAGDLAGAPSAAPGGARASRSPWDPPEPGAVVDPWRPGTTSSPADAGTLPPWHPAAPGGPLDPEFLAGAGTASVGPGSGRAGAPKPSHSTAERNEPPGGPPSPAVAPDAAGPRRSRATDRGPASRPGSAPATRDRRAPLSITADRSASADPAADAEGSAPAPGAPPGPDTEGRIVVVWGAAGAPGRTTVAINLAAELAELATPGRAARRRRERSRPRASARLDPAGPGGAPDAPGVLLVDADTEAPSVAQALAVLDDASAVAALARRAGQGRLTPTAVRRLSPLLRPGLHVATGLSRPDRWRELPAAAMDEVWAVARRAAGVTVVDVGSGVEEPPPGLEGWGAPARHGVALSALAAADTVLVVGAADPVGVRRLVLALNELRERDLAPGAAVIPVVTRVRASVAGSDPERSVLGALARYAQVAEAVLVPDDGPAADRCLLEGRTLAECAPKSPARAPIAALAALLLREPAGVRR